MHLNEVNTIAVVGLSDKPERTSHRVAKYLQGCGYKIVPVNPRVKTVLGEMAYPDVASIPAEIKLDLVNIFRRSDEVLPIVEQAIDRGDAKVIWMQEGVINQPAAELAQNAGMKVVMDTCIYKEHWKQK